MLITAQRWEVKSSILKIHRHPVFNHYLNRFGFSTIERDHSFGSVVIQTPRINQLYLGFYMKSGGLGVGTLSTLNNPGALSPKPIAA